MNSLHKEQLLLHCFKLTNIPWQQTAKLKYDINTFWGPGTKIFSEQFPQVPMWTVLLWWNTQSLWKCTWQVLVLHFYHSHRVKTWTLPYLKSEIKREIITQYLLWDDSFLMMMIGEQPMQSYYRSQLQLAASGWILLLSLHDMITCQINTKTSNPQNSHIFIIIYYWKSSRRKSLLSLCQHADVNIGTKLSWFLHVIWRRQNICDY